VLFVVVVLPSSPPGIKVSSSFIVDDRFCKTPTKPSSSSSS